MDSQSLLLRLGERLRAARLEAGLGVTELAERARVSRRHVTEAEAGRANLSVLKLALLAEALGTRLGELCDVDLAPRRSERIALLGLRGAGKSTLGRELALRLECPFVELDQRAEELSGLTLAEIFHLHGEAGFHRFEAEALERILAEGERCVLATGGSIVADEATFERLRRTCRTVWLRAAPRDHYERVLAQGDRRPIENRPRAMAELEGLLAVRAPLYGRCELTIDTSGRTVGEAAEELLRVLQAPSAPRS